MPEDPVVRFNYFFKDDEFERDKAFGSGRDTILSDIKPSDYAMFRSLAQTAVDRSVLEGPTTDIPRPPDLPRLTRAELQVFHMPPNPGTRLCARREKCLFNMHPEYGYVGREFYPGKEPPEPGSPLGLCINCLLAETRMRADENVKNGVAPSLPINTFTVLVGERDYGSHCMLPTMVDGRRNGIDGHYPRFDTTLRSWQELHLDQARLYGITVAQTSKKLYYYAETNMDFRLASAESTAVSDSPRLNPFLEARTDTSSSHEQSLWH